jgi:DNA repair exonuclease SbcCD nuclease subunit
MGISCLGTEGFEERAFGRMIDLAIEADVDVVLIAGDLFDHARVDDDLLAWTATQLERAARPVVVLVGNHDSLHESSVHHRFRVAEPCSNVFLLDQPAGSMVEIPESDIVVGGRAMVDHDRGFRPLAGVPERPEGRWGVIAAHGLAYPDDRPNHHGSPISHAELAGTGWDYVALGHHHGHRVVREAPTPAVYPGATATARRGEAGVVLVEFGCGSGESAVAFEWVAIPAA